MAQVTALSVTGTPGGTRGFVAKDAAGAGPKPSDQVTALSVMGAPGGLRTFTAKTSGVGAEQHTTLTVWGIPGQLRTFAAKDPADVVVVEAAQIKGGGGPDFEGERIRMRLLMEDEEILAVIMAYRTLH